MFVSLEISFKIRINFSLYSIKKKKKKKGVKYSIRRQNGKNLLDTLLMLKIYFQKKKEEVGEWNEIFKYSVRGVTDL